MNFRKTIHATLFACFISSIPLLWNSVMAQQQQGSISGYIKDTLSSDNLAGANIILLRAEDSMQVAGAATTPDGHYFFKNIKQGKYLVLAIFIDYANQYSDIFQVQPGKNVSVAPLYLKKSATVLEGIEIIAAQKRYVVEDDKIVLNVDNTVTAAASNAFDLLQKAPGISVDQDDNVSLNGSEGISIHFDGREMKLPISAVIDMLKSMPSSNVAKIEVLNDPSARHDAEGSAGILNIVFSEQKNFGWNGSVEGNLSVSNVINGGGGFNLNHLGKKSTLSVGYNYSTWNMKNHSRSESYYLRNNGDTMLKKNEQDFHHGFNSHNVNIGGDYTLSPKDIIGVNVRYNYRYSPIYDIPIRYDMLNSSNAYRSIDSFYTNTSWRDFGSHNFSLNLNYTHKFDSPGQNLKLNLDGMYYDDLSSSGAENKYYFGPDESFIDTSKNEHFRYESPSKSYIGSFTADYTKPFSKTFKMEAGIKDAMAYNDQLFGSKQRVANIWVNDPTVSNQFIYQENIAAAYVSFNKKFSEAFNARFGVRGEFTSYQGHQIVGDSIIGNSYLNLFPNIRIGYNITPKNILSLDYSYRVNRPRYGDLNPFLSKVSNYEYSSGNPELKPHFTHSLSFSYAWNYKIFLNVRYRYSEGRKMRGELYDPVTMIKIRKFLNIGQMQNLNLSVTFNHEFFDWWQIYFNAGTRYISNTVPLQERTQTESSWGLHMNGNSTFILPQKWTIEVSGHFMSSGVRGLTKTFGHRAVDVGVKKTVLDGKMDIRFSIRGLLEKREMYSKTIYPRFITKTWREPRPISFGLSIRYSFGDKQKTRNVNNIEESNRLAPDTDNIFDPGE